MVLDDIPCEVVHSVLEYVTASDLAVLRLVNARVKVRRAQIVGNSTGVCGLLSAIQTVNRGLLS